LLPFEPPFFTSVFKVSIFIDHRWKDEAAMNRWRLILFFFFFVNLLCGCAGNPKDIKIPKDAAKMDVAFSWEGTKPCSHVSPEIQVTGVPEGTVELRAMLKNLNAPKWNQGGGIVDHDGSGLIPEGFLDIGYNGPCPAGGRNKYAFSVMAVDADGEIIGFGKAVRRFPPN
jgi:hypothetical protein